MASYHLCCKVISRGQGRSATAAAAGREYAPVTDRASENEQIMERNALVERPSGII